MKNQKGVTLVALVVTIIILIILAGISINLILGDNGIITIAKKAKENTELAKVEEEKQLNELYTQLEAEGGNSSGGSNDNAIEKLTEFKKAIANAIGNAGGIKPEFSAETSVFEDNIKGIVKEVTKGATATADNISEGKTAWVNGELVTGTGADNERFYNDGKNSNPSNLTCIDLGTGTTFDVSSYEGYQNFSKDNFICPVTYAARQCGNVGTAAPIAAFSVAKTYDSTTGKLTITAKVGCYSDTSVLSLSDVHTYLIY